MERILIKHNIRLLEMMAFAAALAFTACGGNSGSGGSDITPWSGTRQLGVANADTAACSVATDAGGNVFVTGYTSGGLDGNTLTGTFDFFLTKYDSSGAKQ